MDVEQATRTHFFGIDHDWICDLARDGEEMKLEDLCSDLVMIPAEAKVNLLRLLEVLNPIEQVYIAEYKEPWKVTSGYRSPADHVRVYSQINARRKLEKKKPLAIPLGSQHLKGNAVDVSDPKQNLKIFVSDHLHLFEEAGIYFEAFQYTKDWVHMQDAPPKSGNRFYIPY
jgi:hypothetical protein